MRLEKIVWYDRHHVLLSFDKFSYALSRFPRSIKIPTLYQDCLCETSEAWKNFKQFKIFSRSPRPSRFTHALLRSSRFDHTTPYDPPAFLKREERGKRDPSVNLALHVKHRGLRAAPGGPPVAEEVRRSACNQQVSHRCGFESCSWQIFVPHVRKAVVHDCLNKGLLLCNWTYKLDPFPLNPKE